MSSQDQADITFAAANLSMWCIAGKVRTRRSLFDRVFRDSPLLPQHQHALIFLAEQHVGSCGAAQVRGRGSTMRKDIIRLQEELAWRPDGRHEDLGVVSPFVVSRPGWLVALLQRGIRLARQCQ